MDNNKIITDWTDLLPEFNININNEAKVKFTKNTDLSNKIIKDVQVSCILEELNALREQIKNLSENKNKLESELATLLSPFKIGDIIKWETARSHFNYGRIIEIRLWCCDFKSTHPTSRFKWTVSRILKNGSAHRKPCSVFSYQTPILHSVTPPQ